MTEAVEVTLRPIGLGAGEVTSRLVQAATTSGYRVVATSPRSFLLARSVRPRWAVVAGIATLGLGFPFFFVKRQESCALSIDDDREGLRARLAGTLDPVALQRLRAACGVVDEAPVGPVSFRPEPGTSTAAPGWTPPPLLLDADEGLGRTVLRAERPAGPGVQPTSPVADPSQDRTVRRGRPMPSFAVVVDDGRHVPIGPGGVVVGRSPAVSGAETALAIDDRSLSRRHLRLELAGDRVRARDLGSTNGTAIRWPDGRVEELTADTVAPVEPGCTLELGERRIRIIEEDKR
jgi:hypothetical protein